MARSARGTMSTTRRAFIGGLGIGIIEGAMGGVTGQAVHWLVKSLASDYEKLLAPRERQELLRELLQPKGSIGYSAAHSHLSKEQPLWPQGYPSDRAAITAIQKLDANVPQTVE